MTGYDARSLKRPVDGPRQRQTGLRVLPLRKSTQKRKGLAYPSTLTFLPLLHSSSLSLPFYPSSLPILHSPSSYLKEFSLLFQSLFFLFLPSVDLILPPLPCHHSSRSWRDPFLNPQTRPSPYLPFSASPFPSYSTSKIYFP